MGRTRAVRCVRMQRVRGARRHYDWGDPEAIPRLLGEEPDGRPVAELWFGTHHSAPTELSGDGRTLAEAVKADPARILGSDGPACLPFLLKLLAAARPLSIQVHPDAEQAAAGFAAEEAAGIPLDAPERRYRDPHAKPELICAVTPFAATCGIRPVAASLELLAALDVAALDVVQGHLRAAAGDDAAAIDALLGELFAMAPERVRSLIADTAAAASSRPAGSDHALALDWHVRLARQHPDDVGVVIALLLNHVLLQPGDALHLEAGTLHSYLQGVGVEVMGTSDNVLRGGLTSKHVDTTELRRIVVPHAMPVQVQRPAAAVHRYDVGDVGFAVARADLVAAGGAVRVDRPAIVLATSGTATIEGVGADATLRRGEALLMEAVDLPVSVTGDGVVHWAEVLPG